MSEAYTDAIVSLEFELFDKVNNEGGRAACQDDFRTFEIMRGAQFDAWSEEMRESYLADLRSAKSDGRNLVMEKYAYMTGYDYMGELDGIERKLELVEGIMARMTKGTVELYGAYPGVSGRSRPLGTGVAGAVSADAYLFCELLTYSARTLELMSAHIDDLGNRGESLPYKIVDNVARRYGFSGLGEMEARINGLAGQSPGL